MPTKHWSQAPTKQNRQRKIADRRLLEDTNIKARPFQWIKDADKIRRTSLRSAWVEPGQPCPTKAQAQIVDKGQSVQLVREQ
jgi:hypothetical protein